MNRGMAASKQQTTPKSSQVFPSVQTSMLQRVCTCGNHVLVNGECTECSEKKGMLQPKLVIGASNDPLELEADRVADQAIAMSLHSAVNANPLRIQRFFGQARKSSNIASASVNHVLASPGRPLEPLIRQDMEQRFGYDFSGVRVHTGAQAAQSAEDMSARAYTLGQNIVFGTDQFAPETHDGRCLLAHELTHVVQQSGQFSHVVLRQPKGEKKEPSSKIGKELKKNDLFKKLPEFAQEKILDEIDKAPETITQEIFDRIIDLAPIDAQYKDGLKKAGEAIIKTITGRKPPSTSKCDIPGYHEGTSSTYKGMCCSSTIESAATCCPQDKFAPNNSPVCCTADEFVTADYKCEKIPAVDPGSICVPPGKKDALGKCCMPPLEVIDGLCVSPPPQPEPEPPARSFGLKFTVGVIDDFDIDQSVINSRQKPHFDKVKNQIHQFVETCPASIITITGFADKPGTEEHNLGLGQRRADHVKFLLQLDLMKISAGGISPLILARSEGEGNPVDVAAGEKFSARNRRVEIEFNSICPPLGSAPLTKPLRVSPFQLRSPQQFSF